ncbi:MAG TPA: NAD-dependent epimerase/dehydratase family protein [Gemmatimonadales bacterium]|nr:NAD-dependent epimerase/dehydratase family protein [Gemmatimonadales bacterium]
MSGTSRPDLPPILVTGATGFTGSHLVRSLVADGMRVRVLARSATRAVARLPADIEVVEGEISDPPSLARALEGVKQVYHLAAAYREARHKEEYYWTVNFEGTRAMLDAARAAGVRRFVHCSTVGVLSHIANPPADERQPHNPADVYQRTKSEAEKLALARHEPAGMTVAVARPTAIYGPGDTRLLKLFRSIATRRFIMLGSGEIYYHMVYVSDLISGLRLLGEHPRAAGEVFTLGGEGYFQLRAIVDLIARLLEVSPPRQRLPAWPFQLAGSVCERICVPFGIEPPIYRRRVDFFTKSRAFSIQKAKQMLGYAPAVDLESGFRRTIDWYRANGLLPPARS